jgi:serine O-acetyltransferase
MSSEQPTPAPEPRPDGPRDGTGGGSSAADGVAGPAFRKLEKAPPQPIGDRNTNPRDLPFWSLVAEDFRTNGSDIFRQGFWILFLHRFGNWRMDVRWKLLRAPLSLLYHILSKLGEMFFSIYLPYTTPVGRRVCIEHFGGMLLGARSIGNDVTIRQNTTFGIKDKSDLNAKPTIEDHVDIGAGAVIIGNITVGEHATIGPNSVVMNDVPPNSFAIGVPARVMPKNMR